MIYELPAAEGPIDQGDLIDGCPIPWLEAIGQWPAAPPDVVCMPKRVIVLTQTCDLANDKVTAANVAEVVDAQVLVNQGLFKAADIKGPLRGGRLWGWYFLPADAGLGLGLGEMIVDLRRLHTVRLDLLRQLCANGGRKGRVRPLYREHLAKHFADTFSRIGLPRPYETM